MKTRDFIDMLMYNSKTPEPINNKSDYTRVKKWVKKATRSYVIFSILAIVVSLLVFGLSGIFFNILSSTQETPDFLDKWIDIIKIPAGIIILCVALLTGWGFATMKLNFKLMIKSLWNSASAGYRAGEQIETTNVSVVHEYGDRYRVATNTENQGCALAMIYGGINMFVWAFLSVYVCPFLTFKKIKESKKNLKHFKATQM